VTSKITTLMNSRSYAILIDIYNYYYNETLRYHALPLFRSVNCNIILDMGSLNSFRVYCFKSWTS